MSKQFYLLNEVAKLVGVKAHRIAYAIANGHLPEPAERLNNHRIFTAEDIEGIKKYFLQLPADSRRKKLDEQNQTRVDV